MSIKEKVQQIIQQVEAERAAKLRREEEAQRQWLAKCQEEVRQREALETVRFEKGRKAFEATGVQRVFGQVLDILKDADPEVELSIRKGFIHFYIHPKDKPVNQLFSSLGFGFVTEGEYYKAETVGIFVEKARGEGETTTRLGVELEIDNPNKVWVSTAFDFIEKEKDSFFAKDPDLLVKIEDRLAEQIAQGRHQHFNPVREEPDLPPP